MNKLLIIQREMIDNLMNRRQIEIIVSIRHQVDDSFLTEW